MNTGAKNKWRDLSAAHAAKAFGWSPREGDLVTVGSKCTMPQCRPDTYERPPTYKTPGNKALMRLKPGRPYIVLRIAELGAYERTQTARLQELPTRRDGKQTKRKSAWIYVGYLLPYVSEQ